MEGAVKMEFSADGGTTWKKPSGFGHSVDTFQCNFVTPYLMFETESTDGAANMTDSELCARRLARLYIDFDLKIEQFDLSTTAGKGAHRFINSMRCAPRIRIYYKGTSIDGFTDFATDPNTNYLLGDQTDPPQMRNNKAMWAFTLKMVKEYDITKTT